MTEYVKWIRGHVGRQKLLLVSACAVVLNEAGQVLWQLRGDVNRWALPGGMLELNESLPECVVREVREETGLTVQPLRVLGVYSSPDFEVIYPNGDQVQPVTVSFVCRIAGGSLQADGLETLDLAWFPADTVPQTTAWYQIILHDFRSNQKAASFRQGSIGKRQDDVPFFKRIRRHIGQARYITPSGVAFIQNEAGHILLQRRGDNGEWGLLGGAMELGERVDLAVINEVREESGLEVEPVRLIGVYSDRDYCITYPHGDQLKIVSFFFECRVTGGQLQADGEESLELRYFAPDSLPPLAKRNLRRVQDGLAKLTEVIF
jgi:ADP-ribose pyrophosphatase YjhB (NUDIX family)